MTLADFNKQGESTYWLSKDKFWFENKKVKFWYRLYLTAYTYQPGWGNRYETKYQVILVVDDESIHPNHNTSIMKEYRFGYILKEAVKREAFNELIMEKVLNSALKIKVENKIKVGNYQKILGILNGTKFYDY